MAEAVPAGLTLTRSPGQSIVVRHGGETLVIYYAERAGNQVKLHFEGSRSFAINRKEIQDRIDAAVAGD